MALHARRLLVAVLGGIIAGFMLSGGTTVALAQPVGYVAAIEGTVLILRAGEAIPAGEGSVVEVDDRLETGQESRALLVLDDGSRIVIGADTQVALLFLVDAGALSGDRVIELLRGILRIGVHQPDGASNVQTRTPTAVVAARSTEWIIEYADDSTAVLALEGTVAVTALTAEGTVILEPGEGTDVARGQAPTEPAVWGAARAEAARDRTAFGGIR